MLDQNDGKGVDLKLQVNSDILTELLDKKIAEYVAEKFNVEHWVDRVQSIANQLASTKLEKALIDLNIEDTVTKITEQILAKQLVGVDQKSTNVQLTISDGYVVNENEFITNELHVIQNGTFDRNLVVTGDLIVKGRVNTDNQSWSELKDTITSAALKSINESQYNEISKQVTENVLKYAKEGGIDFNEISVNGSLLVKDATLSDSITESKLQSVGNLRQLEVTGEVSLNKNTLNVLNRRIGINTATPTMAVDIWDDEVELVLGKMSENTGFIGLGRKGTLCIGVNQDDAITVSDDGQTIIKKLKIGRNNISWGKEVPGYQGQKGDIVFNMNPGADSAFAWQCLGAFNWRVI